LARDPAGTLKIVLGAAGLAAEEGAIQAAVAKTVPHGGLYGERPYVPRSIERSRYLDRELLAAYESIILDHLPGLAERRVLDPVEYRETVTGRVFAALRAQRGGDAEGAIGILDPAIEAEPENALLHGERAALLLAQRRFGEAWASAERAMRLAPTHRPILEAAVTAALAAGDPSTVVEPMERLHALSDPTLVGRLKLALVRTHGGDGCAADDVLAEVERELPDDAEAWRVAAEIRRARGEPELALAAVETAIRLAPLQGEPYAYRGELLLDAGRPDEAVGALRSALVIDAGQRGWWALLVRAQREAGNEAGALAAAHEAVERFPEDAELRAELAALRERTPDPDPAAGPHDDLARLRIELAQVRAALGVAERRSYELEVRRHRQVSESWDQSHKLDEAMQGSWAQARRLDEALQEKEWAMQEAWEQARRLDVSLQEKEQAMQAAWAQSRLLDKALQEKELSMQAAWAWTEKLDGRARRLRAALEQLDENAPVLREKWV
ncbi:MAG TPA: hypothetical protein VFH48_40665, partial [Chloroflexota bacterium]|nr:hypothetical protein [Chloroflexota bacterium]